MKKIIFYNLFFIFLFSMSLYGQTWPIPQSTGESVFTSSFGPRNLGSVNENHPWQSNTTNGYDYDFHGGLDIAAINLGQVQYGTNANIRAVDDGTIRAVRTESIIIETVDQFGLRWYWKYLHIDPDPSLTSGNTVNAGDNIGTIRQWSPTSGSHLDIRYYALAPPSSTPIWYDDVDQARNPIHRLQYSNSFENPIDLFGFDDDEFFEIVFNQTDNSSSANYNVTELEKENNYFSDQRGAYIYYGMRVDQDELDFKEFKIDPFGVTDFGFEYLDAQIIKSDDYANPEIGNGYPYYSYFSLDFYADATRIDYDFKYNVGDMDGNNDGTVLDETDDFGNPGSDNIADDFPDDRLDDGDAVFNDMGIVPRSLSTTDDAHTVYVKSYIDLSHANNQNYEYFRFNLNLKNTDSGAPDNTTGDIKNQNLYVFTDSETNQFIDLLDGDKAVIEDKLIVNSGGGIRVREGAVLYLKGKTSHATRTELDIKNGATLVVDQGGLVVMDEYTYIGGSYLEFNASDVVRASFTEINADYQGQLKIIGNFAMNTLGQCLMTTNGGVIEIDGDLNISDGSFMLSNTNNPGTYKINGNIYAEGSGNSNTGYVIDLKPGTTMEMGYNDKITIADGSKVRAVGTLADPVTFTYDGTYDPGVESWNGIELRGDGNIFEYTILEHAINPLYFRSDNNVVEYSTIRNNSSYGIRTDLDYSGGWGSVTITDSNIHDNGSHGVYMRKTHGGVQYTNIKDNGGDGMYVYDATVGNPNSSGSEYFRGNDIEDNSGNAVELAYNATLYDGYSTTDGNNNLGHNGSHEVYLSSTSARWHDANGGSYTAVLDNTSSKFVYNLAQTTSGESTISWTVGMENNAWNYVTPSSSKFFGSVDYTPFQTSQMFGSLGPRGSTPSEMNAGELPQMVLSASAVQAKTSGLHSDSERDAYLEQTREIGKLVSAINSNPRNVRVGKDLNGLLGYYNQLPASKKAEYEHVPELLTGFISHKQLAGEISFGGDGSRLTSETALMLQIHQQLQDGNAQEALNNINEHQATFSNLDIKRELGFVKANALEELGRYEEAIATYNELAALSRLGIDSKNTTTDYETLISTMESLRDEELGKEGASSEFASSSDKVKETDATDEKQLPTSFELKEAYPNPFNPSTILSFDLPETGRVRVEVFNIAGQLVSVLTNQRYEAGSHSLQFNAEGLASGVYLVRANLAGTIQSQKVTLIK